MNLKSTSADFSRNLEIAQKDSFLDISSFRKGLMAWSIVGIYKNTKWDKLFNSGLVQFTQSTLILEILLDCSQLKLAWNL